MGFPYRAGQATLGDRADQMSGDSGLRLKTAVIPVEDDPDYMVTDAAIGTTTGVKTIANAYLPYPQSCVLEIIADATVITRTLTARLTGIDQFGGAVDETITVTATAGQTIRAFTTAAFARLDRCEITVATDIQAGDTSGVGILADANTRFALPIEVRNAADVVGGGRMVGGVITAVDWSSATYDLSRMTVRNFGAAANDTVHLVVRSSRTLTS